MSPSKVYNLPNLLSACRIGCVPLIIILAYLPGKVAALSAAAVFGLGALTDFLDGYLARRRGQVTLLGKFLDPVADKLLVSAALIMLVWLRRVPAWAVFVIIGREIAVTGLRAAAAASPGRMIIDSDRWGKLKTVLQILAVLGLLVHYSWFGVDFQLLGTAAFYPALALTMLSGWNYFNNYWRLIIKSESE